MKKIYNIIFALASAALLCIYAVSCNANYDGDYNSEASGDSDNGKGSSIARFTIISTDKGDFMYTVDNRDLSIVSLEDPANPKFLRKTPINFSGDIETIFPYEGYLLIGSQSAMYIYNLENPGFPSMESSVSHLKSCDPVVASHGYAYVTLNTQRSWCGNWQNNELQVYNIADPANPIPLMTTSDYLNYPGSLGIDWEAARLFVCDGASGLKIFKINTDNGSVEIIADTNIHAYDVIPLGGTLVLTGDDGFYQYDYTGESLQLLSAIPVSK